MKRLWIVGLGCWLSLGPAWAGPKAAKDGGYHVVKKVRLPGDAGWDYLTLDAAARRLYVSHEDRVLVLNADSLKKIGSIDGLDHCHGIALAPELHRGFITGGGDGTVVAFDSRTQKRLAVIRTEKGADGIQYDPATKRVFSFNGEGKDVTVIDAEAFKVVSTVKLGGRPESAAVGEGGRLYDALVDKNKVVELDTKTLKVLHRWSTKPGVQPAGFAMDAANGRLFAACHNQKLVVLDAAKGKVVAALPIGDHVDAAWFDPSSGNVFTSNGDGTLTVIHEDSPDRYRVVENAATEKGARTMAYDPKTGRVFTDTAETLETTPVPGQPKWHRKIVPGTFHLLVLEP